MKRVLLFLFCIVITASIGSCLHSTLCVSLDPQNLSSCITLQELQNNTGKYIHSNIKILFERGLHSMNGVLNIQQIKNVTLASSYNDTVIIHCTGFNFSGVRELLIENLTFQNCGNNNSAVLTFHGGANLIISHVTINESTGGVLGVNVSGMTIVTNLILVSSQSTSSFTYGHVEGTLVIKDSFLNKLNAQQNSTLFIHLNHSMVTVQIRNTNFSANSGNLGIRIVGNINRNQTLVSIENCNFTKGNTPKGGGGLYLNTYVSDNVSLCSCPPKMLDITIIKINSVLFDGNSASVGGGIYMEQKNHPDACTSKIIEIKNSTFTNNALVGNERGGTALHSITYILKGSMNQMVPQFKPKLIKCIFRNNHVKGEDTETTGTGVIFVNKNEYFEIDSINVTNNSNCSGILSVTSNIVLRGTILLSNNTAASGGGLLLCKNGILYFTPHTNLIIVNNHVSHSGGGICVEAQCLQTRPRCFFQLHQVEKYSMIDTINVTVKNNSAGYAGDDIFGGLVDFCYMLDDPIYPEGGSKVNLDIFNKTFHMTNSSTVTSIAQHVCQCNNNQLNCLNNSISFEVYPGQEFPLAVVLAGQLNGTVPGFVYAEVAGHKNVSVHPEQQHQHTEKNCTELMYALIMNSSYVDTNINVTLKLTVDHSGDISGYVKIPSNKPLNIMVTIKPCPLGFQLTNGICNCSLLTQNTSMHCDITNKVIFKKPKRQNSWIGNKDGHVVFHTNCPYDYCITDKKICINVTDEGTLLQDKQCQFNRTGTLCGACPSNLSMVLGSSECRACQSTFFTLILIFGLAGLALVVFLTCLNLTIAEGTLSGLIFYANIVWHNNDLFIRLQQQNSTFSKLLHIFLAWLNLDLGITKCFYDGMDAYQKAWFQFAFPVYVWTISFVIIFLSNRFQVIARLASRIAVKVLATLILLSYTKFVRAAVRIFAFTSLNTISQANKSNLLWLEDANIEYWNRKHLVLFCFGVFFVALVSPYTLTLLFIKQLHSLAHWRVFKWVQTLKPFLDAYTGPYTKHARFWPGLLLLARVVLSVLSGINHFESDKTRSLIGGSTVLLLLSISNSVKQGLYEKHYLDKLETSFLLNLGFLYLVSSQAHSIKYAYEVLVGISFFSFLCIVVYHMWLKCCHYTCTARISSTVMTKVSQIQAKFKSKDKSINRLQNYPPFVQFTEDREPLLADYED